MSIIDTENLGPYGAPPIDVTNTTWRMYSQGVPSGAQNSDSSQEPPYPLLRYMSLVGDQMGVVEELLDQITYVSPAAGGPPADSDEPYSYSTLVDPWEADPNWIPWLAMVSGTNITGLSLLQARLAIASQQTYGKYQGSKLAIQEAVRSLYAYEVPSAVAVAGGTTLTLPTPASVILPLASSNIVNPGEAGYTGDDSWAEWVPVYASNYITISPSAQSYNGASAIQVVAVPEIFSIQLTRPIPVVGGATYTVQLSALSPLSNSTPCNAAVQVYWYNSTGASISYYLTAATSYVSGVWQQLPGDTTVTVPATATYCLIRVDFQTGIPTGLPTEIYFTNLQIIGPNPNGSIQGSLLFGQGVPEGCSVVGVLANSQIEMSAPTVGGINGNVVVVPNIPVAVLDHYGNSPVTTWMAVNPIDAGASVQNLTNEYNIASVSSPLSGFGQAIQFQGNGSWVNGPAGATVAQGAMTSTWAVDLVYEPSAADLAAGGAYIAGRGTVGGAPTPGEGTGAEWSIQTTTNGFEVFVDNSAVGSWAVLSAGTAYKLEVDISGGKAYVFVNGVLQNSGGTAVTVPTASATRFLQLGGSSPSGVWCTGIVDEVRISTAARNTSNFSAPSSPYTVDGTTANLYHLDAGPFAVSTASSFANPWGLGVFVPSGISLAAAYNAAVTQKAAGYSLTLLYTYADWANLYQTFGNGSNISWTDIAGLSWQTWEQTT